jgi:hypothetical protein
MRYLIICFSSIIVTLCVGCTPVDKATSLHGVWRGSTESNPQTIAQLSLLANGEFKINGIDAAVACAAKTQGTIDGQGKWEFDSGSRKIILSFKSISNPVCASPFAGNAFVESWLMTDSVIFYPDGPDQPRSKITLKKISS